MKRKFINGALIGGLFVAAEGLFIELYPQRATLNATVLYNILGLGITLLILGAIGGLLMVASFSLMKVILFPVIKELRVSRKRRPQSKSIASLCCLLRLFLTEEDVENIVGDLWEEYTNFQSKADGHVWLYKQVLKSVLPLVAKTIRSRLASYFRGRIG